MVKLEVTDDGLLKAAAVVSGAFGAGLVAAPKPLHNNFFAAGQPYSGELTRYFGGAQLAVSGLTVSAIGKDASKDTKKKALKVTGAFQLGLAGHSLYNQYKKTEKSDPVSLAVNGANALFGAALVAQGFRK